MKARVNGERLAVAYFLEDDKYKVVWVEKREAPWD